MFIRKSIYATQNDISNCVFYADIPTLIASTDQSSVTFDSLHLQCVNLIKNITSNASAAHVKTQEDRQQYFDRITEVIEGSSNLLKALDQIYIHIPIYTDKGKQFHLTDSDYGLPIANAANTNAEFALVGPYSIPTALCSISIQENGIKECTAVGDLNLLNNQLTLEQNSFLLTDNLLTSILSLTNGELESVTAQLKEMDERLSSFIMFKNPFSQLLTHKGLAHTFSQSYDDLLDEAKMQSSWNDPENKYANLIEKYRSQKESLAQSIKAFYNDYSEKSLTKDIIDALIKTRPETWKKDLLLMNIHGVAHSNDTTSISAQRGKPIPSKYEFFDSMFFIESKSVTANLDSIKTQPANTLSPIQDQQLFLDRVLYLDELLTSICLAKTNPTLLTSDNLSRKAMGFIKHLKLTNLHIDNANTGQ